MTMSASYPFQGSCNVTPLVAQASVINSAGSVRREDATEGSQRSGREPQSHSPLELEHAIGCNGKNLHTAVLHPTAIPLVAVCAIGKLVVTVNTEDLQDQHIFKGHDAVVTAVDVSNSGDFLVSGQSASETGKDGMGYIIVWDYHARHKCYVLPGHLGGIYAVRFSPDDRWLASTGKDVKTLIWDVQTSELSGGLKDVMENDAALGLAWGAITEPGTRRQAYDLFITYNTGVRLCTWGFDLKTMQYRSASLTFQLPGSGGRIGGFMRQYNCVCLCGDSLLCGTASDLLIFGVESKLFKVNIVLGMGGVLSMVELRNESSAVLVGCGDGRLFKLKQKGAGAYGGAGGRVKRESMATAHDWEAAGELQLPPGGVTSLSLSGDGTEVLAGTSKGELYRIHPSTLSATLLSVSHTDSVVDVAVPSNQSDVFATASTDNTVRLWSMDSYTQLSLYSTQKSTPTCIAFSQTQSPAPQQQHQRPTDLQPLITGWADGTISCLDLGEKAASVLWCIATAHRGAVCAVSSSEHYILSAGSDGATRVWAAKSRECVAVVEAHAKKVTAVLPDATSARILHSCSLDKTVMTFDLAQQCGLPNRQGPKRLVYKTEPESSGFVALAQKTTGERELVLATADGSVLMYDIDYAQPVCSVAEVPKIHINTMSLDPASSAIAVGRQDGSILVYRIPGDQPEAHLTAYAAAHSTAVLKLVWSHDGKQLISTGSDGEVYVWNYYL